jgi:hypothetical protein
MWVLLLFMRTYYGFNRNRINRLIGFYFDRIRLYRLWWPNAGPSKKYWEKGSFHIRTRRGMRAKTVVGRRSYSTPPNGQRNVTSRRERPNNRLL